MASSDKILLSIITVVYNGAQYLEKTIQSVVNQTYDNIEYIIIDGGSTDGSVDIIKKYTDKINYWISEKDKGIFDAMNKGLQNVNGEFVAFMNAGDYYELEACAEMVMVMKQYLGVDVFYGDTNLIISTLKFKYGYKIYPTPTIDDNILIAPLFCHQSSFVRREMFDKYGSFDNVGIAGDWLHFVTLYNNGAKFKYVNKPIANYLEGGASTTVKGFRESFLYKRKFGTFRKKDYLTLFFFYIKDNYVFRNIINPLLWRGKIFINPTRYKKLI